MNNIRYFPGLVSISFRQHTPKEILEAMKTAGLSYIEWGSDVHAPCDNFEALNEIVALQKEYGIVCSSYGTYFRLGETPLCELENYIKAAKILGTDILRLWCGKKSGKQMTEDEKNELLSVCMKAASIAEQHNVTLCMECHPNSFTEIPDDAVWLMNTVNSPNFRMYWQPFQWQTFEQNIENSKKIAPFAKHIHVFNWDNDENFPLADAVEQWRAYLNNFSTPRMLLLEFMPNGSIEELVAEAAALKLIIGEKI